MLKKQISLLEDAKPQQTQQREKGLLAGLFSLFVCVCECVWCACENAFGRLLSLPPSQQTNKPNKAREVASHRSSGWLQALWVILPGLLISNPQVEALHMGGIGMPGVICATCVPPFQRDTLGKKRLIAFYINNLTKVRGVNVQNTENYRFYGLS
jgi:hypothetical protein